MRAKFYLAGRRNEWDAGVAAWLSDRLDIALKETAAGITGNVPGKFRANIWGDPRQREIIKAALPDKAAAGGMEKLMEVLKASARSLPEGSPTVTDLAASQAGIAGKGLKFAGKVLSPGSYLNLGDELVKGYEALRTPAARIKLAHALLDPKSLKTLKKMRMLSPLSERAIALTVQLLTVAGISEGVRKTRQPRDFPAPGANALLPQPDQISVP
jgi:hypothetical protein